MKKSIAVTVTTVLFLVSIIVLNVVVESCIPEVVPPLTGDISITQNSFDVTSGVSTVEWGLVTSGNDDKVFIITNSGEGELILNGSSAVDITGDSQFSVLSQPDSTINAGATSDFTIRFTFADTASPVNASVTILSNDEDEGTFSFSVSGTDGAL